MLSKVSEPIVSASEKDQLFLDFTLILRKDSWVKYLTLREVGLRKGLHGAVWKTVQSQELWVILGGHGVWRLEAGPRSLSSLKKGFSKETEIVKERKHLLEAK